MDYFSFADFYNNHDNITFYKMIRFEFTVTQKKWRTHRYRHSGFARWDRFWILGELGLFKARPWGSCRSSVGTCHNCGDRSPGVRVWSPFRDAKNGRRTPCLNPAAAETHPLQSGASPSHRPKARNKPSRKSPKVWAPRRTIWQCSRAYSSKRTKPNNRMSNQTSIATDSWHPQCSKS